MIIISSAVLVFLVLRFSVTLFNFISNPKLSASGTRFDDLVSILIPVKNQEANIVSLLESIQAQDHDNYEVIVMDCQSADHTYAFAEEFCRSDPRFRVLKYIAQSGTIWNRNAVCQELSLQAKGDYYLFLESDTVIQRRLINSMIYRVKIFKLAVLSLMPNLYMTSFMEKCILPLSDYVLLNLLPLRLVSLFNHPVFSAGNNQCLFFDAQIYRENNWYERLTRRQAEGGDLVRLVKQYKYRTEVLLANRFIYAGKYKTNSELIITYGKYLFSNFGNNAAAAIIYLLLIIAGPIFLMYTDFALYVLPIGLIFLTRIMTSFLTRQNALWNILLHPVQMILLTVILFGSIFRKEGAEENADVPE